MRRLTVTGFTDDGTELLLTAEPARSGPEAREGTYVLALDDRLWAALRQDRARLSQLQLADPAAVRPRDIQARVRAGQSAEEIADAAGVPVARVTAFALPVIAEREHLARAAQSTPLRHRSGPPVTLGDAVRAALGRTSLDGGVPGRGGAPAADLTWDAYRPAGGGWIVRVEGAGRPAHFAYDPVARSVVPDDDAARDLVAEPEPEPAIGVTGYDVTPRRAEPDTSDPSGGPAAQPAAASGERAGQVPGARSATGTRESGRGRRTLRYLAFRDEEPDTGSAPDDGVAGEMADVAGIGVSVTALTVTPLGGTGSAATGSAGGGSVGGASGTSGSGPSGRGGDPDTPPLGALFDTGDDRGLTDLPEGAAPRRAAGRRPAVPSWDEIMFGRRDDQG